MPKPSEEQITNLKAQYGELFSITVGDDDYILKKAGRPQVKRFIDTVQKSPYESSVALVRDCLVFPSQDEFARAADANPNLAILISGEFQDLTGGLSQVSSKKL